MIFPTLHPGEGHIGGEHYLPSHPDEVLWGWLPNAQTRPALSVASGDTVTIDTVSHEGILEDQGRDPVSYFAQFGVTNVLKDVIDIASSPLAHDDSCGPHIVTGPVRVANADPGDVLKIEVLDLAMRVPYGFVSSRHGYGALAGEFPEFPDSEPVREVDQIVSMGTICHFSWVEMLQGKPYGKIAAGHGSGRTVQFPVNPFLGIMGVARATEDPVPSVPPGTHGGNIDIKHVVTGSTLYLPVQVEGANFFAGDPHFAQGNGEVALTALEASLRATVRLTVLKSGDAHSAIGALTNPVVETATHWIPTGMDADLDEAMRIAVRNAIAFLNTRFGVPRDVALAYLSAAGDFEVSQVVDAVKGVHCMIRKADWAAWL
ncbi:MULTISPECIES: acetamidase/formamidase family protein [Mycolicibacterium]|jgi:acetamidase/formamidase|uniref:Acetamidase/Formamidase n=1 Tax=Mycolicibacterium vanbaalenii (strain DSM 7251 / JCM 13017 / BCRC 16820 / KCTC 9966 / NRRL B-24157 / PYR-1) TaxID=350058 RepID=A1T1T9_MYCVP|nr:MULTISPECIES: acetamidase/formamidase family protein [Mycolicibacterium]ABM11139.1 Acetamidase/Formamidase [Mycolicibacterium vanbaalenii PYR-1]MCV7128379.1 acetamidase/formamidase family protein [Mycolicibacterium vanbaalenii PYR-1]MDW5614887.1 acetamidase/formamidase family protein [Mycolicibacterium sp. D5.8-2]QZY46598.1 acetamidase/formamidase family protein [Mycolicibacterium austroafricanum]